MLINVFLYQDICSMWVCVKEKKEASGVHVQVGRFVVIKSRVLARRSVMLHIGSHKALLI